MKTRFDQAIENAYVKLQEGLSIDEKIVYPYVFIDESDYDEYTDRSKKYEGWRELTVYGLPEEEISDQDEAIIDHYYKNRDSYPKLGSAKVGFTIDDNEPEIILKSGDFNKKSVRFLYPTLGI